MEQIEFDIQFITDEILNKLRSYMYQFDKKERIELKTQTFLYDGEPNTYYKLNGTVSFVKSISVEGVDLDFGHDYNIFMRDENMGSVFIKKSLTYGDEIVVTYGVISAGGSNFVYDDFPLSTLKDESYPRIGFEITDRISPGGFGNSTKMVHSHDILVQVMCISLSKNETVLFLQKVFDFLTTNAQKFYSFKYIEPRNISGINNFNDNNAYTKEKIIEFTIPNRYQVVQLEA